MQIPNGPLWVSVFSRDITQRDYNASHVTGTRGGRRALHVYKSPYRKSTCIARQESRTRVYRAPCWTNRIPDLFFFLFISLQLSLPYIRGVKLRANPPDLAGAYRTRLGLSTCISALEGPGRHSFLPPHTHALFLTPFFSSSFRQLLRRSHSLAPNLLLLFLGEL